jgi:hypothetical protein
LEFHKRRVYGFSKVNGRATVVLRCWSAALCGLVALHAAVFPLTAFPLSPARVVVSGSLDEQAGKAALKQPDTLLWSASMQATWKSILRRSEARTADLEPGSPRQAMLRRRGASFARSYFAPRAHRILAPPSTNDPDA